jgi:hypothetical protein
VLLYDRVFEIVSRDVRRAGPNAESYMNPAERALWRNMRRAVVYDVSAVAALVDDWERESAKPIPKTPPHHILWAEWSVTEEPFNMEVGTLLATLGPCARVRAAFQKEFGDRWGDCGWREVVDGDECFMAQTFRRPLFGKLKGEVFCDTGIFYFALSEQGKLVKTLRMSAETKAEGREIKTFSLPIWGPPPDQVNYHKSCTPWPPFMAFALLHCKNVVTETHVPDAGLQRRVQKAGNPPRVTFKTLKIEVPQATHGREGYSPEGEDDGPKVRFHLCSGHFKNLQHERYKNKGWHWWPAHWKGSKDLGEVHKRYQLESK